MAAVRQETGLRVAVQVEELASVCNERPRRTVAAGGMLSDHQAQLHTATDHVLHRVEIHSLHETT